MDAAEELIRKLVAWRVEIDRVRGEASSGLQWRLADGYAELAGMSRRWTQRQIAKACGCSQTHVCHCIQAVRDYPGNQARGVFQDAYGAVKARATAAAPASALAASFPCNNVDAYAEIGLRYFTLDAIKGAFARLVIHDENTCGDLGEAT